MIILCERVCPDDLHDLLSDPGRAKGILDPPVVGRED
jgi:hypothetical protein